MEEEIEEKEEEEKRRIKDEDRKLDSYRGRGGRFVRNSRKG